MNDCITGSANCKDSQPKTLLLRILTLLPRNTGILVSRHIGYTDRRTKELITNWTRAHTVWTRSPSAVDFIEPIWTFQSLLSTSSSRWTSSLTRRLRRDWNAANACSWFSRTSVLWSVAKCKKRPRIRSSNIAIASWPPSSDLTLSLEVSFGVTAAKGSSILIQPAESLP